MVAVEHQVGAFRCKRVILVPIARAIFDPFVSFKLRKLDGRGFPALPARVSVAAIFQGIQRFIAMFAFPFGSLDGQSP
jgi:hypothetical protein